VSDFFQRLSKPIISREDALLVIRDAVWACYLVAGLQFLVGVFLSLVGLVLGWTCILSAVIYALLGGWLQQSRSRVPAALLLAISVVALVMTVLGFLRIVVAGRNLFLAALMAAVALRAWDATTILASSSRKNEDFIAS
jgi:hypothetical protein